MFPSWDLCISPWELCISPWDLCISPSTDSNPMPGGTVGGDIDGGIVVAIAVDVGDVVVVDAVVLLLDKVIVIGSVVVAGGFSFVCC